MKKLLLVGVLALSAASCSPDIKQEPAPQFVVAQFDPAASPAVVPSPNDLAIDPATGLVNAPIDPKSSAAQQEFTKDYVNTLNGFPTSIASTTTIVGLDKATVNTSTVRFIDLLQGTPIATPPVTPEIAYDPDANQLVIRPPATGWPKGGRYAVALIGGDNGLKGAKGEKVVGSPVWALASLDKPLVTCEDLTAPDCKPTTDLIPAESTDPVQHAKEQTAAALQLEQLRRAYAPLLDAVAAQGVKRQDIVLLWTFRIMNMPEATFDPANSVIPFPNNILLANPGQTTQHVNLPIPPNASPLQQQLIGGLNTLDGFSTTSPIVSENSDTLGAIDKGSKLDTNSLAAGTKFFKLSPGGTQPNVKACLNCASSNPAANNPQQLQFVPQVPLDEKSTYAAVMTTDLKDEKGRFVAPSSVFALVRLSNPLAVDGKSQVSVLSDAQANALEPLRAGFKGMFDGLEAKESLPRSKIALAWAFTTQSTVYIQKTLAGLPARLAANGLISQPGYLLDITTQVTGQMTALGLPHDKIGKVYQGSVELPFLLTGTGGTLNLTKPTYVWVPFTLTLPSDAAPATGYPITIFSHGLKSTRNTALPILNALATAGHATIAIDTVFHGDRSSCAGITAAAGITEGSSGPAIDTPDKACSTGTCDVNPTSATYGRCITATQAACDPSPTATVAGDLFCASQGQGRCFATNPATPSAGICEGGAFKTDSSGVPYISGWNLLNLSNLFATRDNFRQHTVDHSQLERVLSSTATGNINDQLAAKGAGKLDATKIDYIGQSLGGILGPLYTAASPTVRHAVFNVPAGDLTGVLLTSPAFAAARTGFLASLSSQGITVGTPAFDQFIGLAKMILDPADPINYVYSVENGSTAAGRQAFIQYIENDQVTPNPTTEELIAAANNRATTQQKVDVYKFAPTEAQLPLDARHGFLLNFANPTVTGQAQAQAIQFLDTGALPAP